MRMAVEKERRENNPGSERSFVYGFPAGNCYAYTGHGRTVHDFVHSNCRNMLVLSVEGVRAMSASAEGRAFATRYYSISTSEVKSPTGNSSNRAQTYLTDSVGIWAPVFLS